ncbi:STAS domain-containing protein [Mycobacterium simiae]|uniref:Anti-sigma factor antagonist n=1 Tax=Mycobacterium simiae TaxID=1784 RepID=A0A5B1BL80_MYCSI|nr:STAS domain-containing protein [Mycobacterium simiae]KAA1249447.1 STAS domain-containing protein [Mycobacterium simiae]
MDEGLISTSVEQSEGVLVVVVAGEVDTSTAITLETAIDQALSAAPPALVIDLSAVRFFGSAGLNVLAQTNESVRESTNFAVVASSPATSIPLQVTGIDKLLPVYESLDEALCVVRTDTHK